MKGKHESEETGEIVACDRRIHHRFRMDNGGSMIFVAETEDRMIGRLKDIGEGGLRIEYYPINESRERGEQIRARIFSNQHILLDKVAAVVAYDMAGEEGCPLPPAASRNCGLAFEGLSGIQRISLRRLIESVARDAGADA